MGAQWGWQAILHEATTLEAIAGHLRALVPDGAAAFRSLEERLAAAESREKAAVADACEAEEELRDLLARCKQDETERQRILGELESAHKEREAATAAKESAEGVTAQLVAEVAQLKRGMEGLQSLVSRREEEARGKWATL